MILDFYFCYSETWLCCHNKTEGDINNDKFKDVKKNGADGGLWTYSLQGSQHIRDDYGTYSRGLGDFFPNIMMYNAFALRPAPCKQYTPEIALTNNLIPPEETLQGDIKTGFQEIEGKLKANIAQMNYFLHGLDIALNGDMGTSNGKFDELEKIYAAQGGYPGHWDRHHRGFRDALLSRFTRQDDRSNGLESRITQVNDTQSREIATLKTQVRDIWGGLNRANERIQEKDSAIQELKNSVKELQAKVTTLTAENEKLKGTVNDHKRMIEKIQKSIRSASPRSLSTGRQARH